MEIVIKIPEEIYKNKNYIDYFGCSSLTLADAIENGTPIPDNATNGDMIKAIFPNIQISDSEVMKNVYTGIPYGELIGANIDCMREWWNSPYQKGGK